MQDTNVWDKTSTTWGEEKKKVGISVTSIVDKLIIFYLILTNPICGVNHILYTKLHWFSKLVNNRFLMFYF